MHVTSLTTKVKLFKQANDFAEPIWKILLEYVAEKEIIGKVQPPNMKATGLRDCLVRAIGNEETQGAIIKKIKETVENMSDN